MENPEVISKDRVAAKLKKIRQDYKKAADTKRKSGGGRVVFVFYDLCETIWGSPAVTSLQEGIDPSSQADQENVDCVLNRPDDQLDSVGLQAEILRSRTQPNFYCNSNMFPSPRGFHYQNRHVQNINANNEMVPKNSKNTFS